MNGRERILALLAGEQVDCLSLLPITMMFAADQIAVPCGKYVADHDVLASAQIYTAETFDFDYVAVISDAAEAIDCGAVMLSLFDQITGINIVIYYIQKILLELGFSEAGAKQGMLILGVTNFLTTILALLDRIGRKPLLMFCPLGISICMLVVGFEFFTGNFPPVIVLTSIVAYCFCYSLGPVASPLTLRFAPPGGLATAKVYRGRNGFTLAHCG